MQGHAAADQAGVPPLRDDGHADVSAQGQHGGNLGRITRPNDGRRMALEPARPVHGETGRRVTSQDMRLAHDAASDRSSELGSVIIRSVSLARRSGQGDPASPRPST